METHPPNSDESQSLIDDQDQTIILMYQSGYSEELICASTGASQPKVSRIISQIREGRIKPNYRRQPGTLVDQNIFKISSSNANENPVKSPSQQKESHPAYIYTCNHESTLYATKLSTKKTKIIQLSTVKFCNEIMQFVMLPTGKLFFPSILREKAFDSDSYSEKYSETALVIDPFKEFAVLEKPKLPNERYYFIAIYFSSYLYVMGGICYTKTRIARDECDRFDCRTDHWESFAPLPQECYQASVVETNNCLFVLGGLGFNDYKQMIFFKVEIQRLNLNLLEWDVLPIKLPAPAENISCFSRGSEVYFIVYGFLYSFTPDSIKFIQNVSSSPYSQGPSYLYKTTLFCTKLFSAANIFELGEIEAFGS